MFIFNICIYIIIYIYINIIYIIYNIFLDIYTCICVYLYIHNKYPQYTHYYVNIMYTKLLFWM